MYLRARSKSNCEQGKSTPSYQCSGTDDLSERRDRNIKSYKVLNGGFRISTRRSRVSEAHHTAALPSHVKIINNFSICLRVMESVLSCNTRHLLGFQFRIKLWVILASLWFVCAASFHSGEDQINWLRAFRGGGLFCGLNISYPTYLDPTQQWGVRCYFKLNSFPCFAFWDAGQFS